VSVINDELINYLAQHPEEMHDMAPRKFEELVADIFRAKGYTVELTPATPGRRIRHARILPQRRRNLLDIDRMQTLRPNAARVGRGRPRGLYGVTENERANASLIVTTSSFTRDAKSFQGQIKYQIKLADQVDLQAWLRNHERK